MIKIKLLAIFIFTLINIYSIKAQSNHSVLIKRAVKPLDFFPFSAKEYEQLQFKEYKDEHTSIYFVKVNDKSINHRLKELRCDFNKYILNKNIRFYYSEWLNYTTPNKPPTLIRKGTNLNVLQTFEIYGHPRLKC